MLAIRMQRTGRKGSAHFRMIVQDSRRSPTSGNIVALVGHYDPHSKVTTLDKDKVSKYLLDGAQPSDRVIRILQQEKIKLPTWVKLPPKKSSAIKNKNKLRRNRPVEEAKAEPEAVKVATEPAETVAEAEPAEAENTETESADSADDTEVETEADEAVKTEPEETAEAEPEAKEIDSDKPAEK